MNDQSAGERRQRSVVAGFPVFDAGAERDVEQAAGAGVGIERRAAGIGGMVSLR